MWHNLFGVCIGWQMGINNVLICWGRIRFSNTRPTQTLPISYTRVYSVNISYFSQGLSNGALCINSRNLSNFSCILWDGYPIFYICIGY